MYQSANNDEHNESDDGGAGGNKGMNATAGYNLTASNRLISNFMP